MGNKIQVLLLIVLVVVLGTTVHGKRKAPELVKPVVYEGIVYSAPAFLKKGSQFIRGQYIEAHRQDTKEKLWDLKVYTVIYQQQKETDVQDVFISKLEVIEGNLIVTDELGRRFKVDLGTKTVIELKDNSKQ